MVPLSFIIHIQPKAVISIAPVTNRERDDDDDDDEMTTVVNVLGFRVSSVTYF